MGKDKKDEGIPLAGYVKHLVAETLKHNSGEITCEEELEKALKKMDPKPTVSGFVEVKVVVTCECGNLLQLHAEPELPSEEQLEEMLKDEYTSYHEWGDKDNAKNKMAAANLGCSTIRCDCGQTYLCGWEMGAVGVSAETKFPWGEPESPRSVPSSGLSAFAIKGNDTVH
jgi:hypothetical protein